MKKQILKATFLYYFKLGSKLSQLRVIYMVPVIELRRNGNED